MNKQLLLIIGLATNPLLSHTHAEIQQLIGSTDYADAIKAISALPTARVSDRQQLLLNMIDAWTRDSTVGLYAQPIRKAADSLVGGNRNNIYGRVGQCIRAMPFVPPVTIPEPVIELPIVQEPAPPVEPTIELELIPVMPEPSEPELPVVIEEPEPIKLDEEPTTAQEAIPLPPLVPIIEPIHIPEPERVAPPPHRPSFIRHAAALITFIGVGVGCIWALLADKKEKRKEEPAIPPAPPLGQFSIPPSVPVINETALAAAIRKIADAHKKPVNPPPSQSNPTNDTHPADHKPKRVKLSSPEIVDEDTGEAVQAKISSYCDQIKGEQNHFAQSLSAHQAKGKLKSTEHRMLMQRHNHLKEALRDLNQSLEPNNAANARLSDADKKELTERATLLTIEIMKNEQMLNELKALIEDPLTMKFGATGVAIDDNEDMLSTRRLNRENQVD